MLDFQWNSAQMHQTMNYRAGQYGVSYTFVLNGSTADLQNYKPVMVQKQYSTKIRDRASELSNEIIHVAGNNPQPSFHKQL